MKNLNELFEYAMWIVEECGIEPGTITNVSVNTRAKKMFGKCTHILTVNPRLRAVAELADTFSHE